jgi:hypothetical protein
MDAADKGHTAIVQLLVTGKADINAQSPVSVIFGWYLAHSAVSWTLYYLLRYAVQSFDVFSAVHVLDCCKSFSYCCCLMQSQDGWTALMYASREAHTAIVKILLDARADTDLKNKVRHGCCVVSWCHVVQLEPRVCTSTGF